MPERENISFGIVVGLNFIYIILLRLIFNKKNRGWQSYTVMVLNYIVMTLVFPIYAFYLDFILKHLEKNQYRILAGIIGLIFSSLYTYLS